MPESTVSPRTPRPGRADHMDTRTRGAGAPGGVTARQAARLAGVGYLAIFVLAILANSTVTTADLPATGAFEASAAVRAAAAAFVVVGVVDVLVAWALHVLLGPDSPQVSLLAAWMRVLHAVLMAAGAAVLTTLGEDVFTALWMTGLLFFGVHLVLLAGLIASRGVSRWLPVLLRVAGTAYAVDTVLHLVLSDYDVVAGVMLPIVAVPSVVGELWLAIWLLRGAGTQPR